MEESGSGKTPHQRTRGSSFFTVSPQSAFEKVKRKRYTSNPETQAAVQELSHIMNQLQNIFVHAPMDKLAPLERQRMQDYVQIANRIAADGVNTNPSNQDEDSHLLAICDSKITKYSSIMMEVQKLLHQ